MSYQMIAVTFLVVALTPGWGNSQYLPLEQGNEWVYRNQTGDGEFRIRVGLPAVIDGKVYYRLTGYADRAVWARFGSDGALYFRDEERDTDRLLTQFSGAAGWFEAPLRGCPHVGKPEEKPTPYAGKAGRFGEAHRISYVAHGCADTGVSEEVFAANAGLLRRVRVTMAGPQVYELSQARVGNWILNIAPEVSFSVSAEWEKRPGREAELVGTIRLANRSGQALRLGFTSAQRFDAEIKTQEGRQLWRWSAQQMFAQVMGEEAIPAGGERVYRFVLALEELPQRKESEAWRLECWLTNFEGGQFRAATGLTAQRE